MKAWNELQEQKANDNNLEPLVPVVFFAEGGLPFRSFVYYIPNKFFVSKRYLPTISVSKGKWARKKKSWVRLQALKCLKWMYVYGYTHVYNTIECFDMVYIVELLKQAG